MQLTAAALSPVRSLETRIPPHSYKRPSAERSSNVSVVTVGNYVDFFAGSGGCFGDLTTMKISHVYRARQTLPRRTITPKAGTAAHLEEARSGVNGSAQKQRAMSTTLQTNAHEKTRMSRG